MLLFIIVDDHSRVVLSLQDNIAGSDYINASFIDVSMHGQYLTHRRAPDFFLVSPHCMQAYQQPSGYVATQGPLPSTFPDFWRMAWELTAPSIVMLTNLEEQDLV